MSAWTRKSLRGQVAKTQEETMRNLSLNPLRSRALRPEPLFAPAAPVNGSALDPVCSTQTQATPVDGCNWVLSSLELRRGLLVRELPSEATDIHWPELFPAH
jgi:hypothetical protein